MQVTLHHIQLHPVKHRRISTLVVIAAAIVVLLTWAASGQARQAPLELHADPELQIPLMRHSDMLQVDSRHADISYISAAATQQDFHAVKTLDHRFSAAGGHYWFRFTLHNTEASALPLWLIADNYNIDKLSLYAPVTDAARSIGKTISAADNKAQVSGTEYHREVAGKRFRKPNQVQQDRLHILPLVVPPQSQATYYLELAHRGHVSFAPRLYSQQSKASYARQLNTMLGLAYGIILALFVCSLTFFLTLRDIAFCYYMLLLGSTFLLIATLQGSLRFVPAELNWFWNHIDYVCIAVYLFSLILFTNKFLRLAQYQPRLSRLSLITGLLPGAGIALRFFNTQLSEVYLFLSGSLAVLTALACSAYMAKNKHPSALFAAVASAVLLVPVAMRVISPSSEFLSISASNIYSFCVILQMLALGAGLCAKFNLLSRQLNQEIQTRRSRETQLIQAQEIARYGDWRWDLETDHFEFSPATLAILPELEKCRRGGIQEILAYAMPADRRAMIKTYLTAKRRRQGFRTEFTLAGEDGDIHYYLIQADFQRDEQGAPVSTLIGTLHDITDSKLAHRALLEKEQRWRELADSTFEAILIFKNGLIIDGNQACEELLGLPINQLIGTRGEKFFGKNTALLMASQIDRADQRAIEYTIPNLQLGELQIEIRCKKGVYKQSEVRIISIRDISERKLYEQQLEKMGLYDSLTGLANRTLLRQTLQRAIDESLGTDRINALLFIDLDQFKDVNDSLGHDVGDLLLIEVGRRLLEEVDDSSSVARLGGDEFAIVIENISSTEVAASLAQRLIAKMAETLAIQGYQLQVTPSIGIVLFPTDGSEISELIRKADFAMYQAKQEGRNNYQFYTERLNEKIIRRVQLESDLHHALQNNEFVLSYQPKVNLADGAIVGAEAILFWQSEKRGIVSPGDFIGISEETGLIWQIGDFVLREACLAARKWCREFPRFRGVAVNISGVQFSNDELVERIGNILRETDTPAKFIELEITEGAVINNAEDAIVMMHHLKSLGVKLSLDDFGTGYSSLNYLKRFPVDSLKIDRSFITEIVSNRNDRKIATHIINLAHDLELNVVGEGVETIEQLEVIRDLGCNELQGFIFSRPCPPDKLEQMLLDGKHLTL